MRPGNWLEADWAGVKVLSSARLEADDAVWLAKTAHNFGARIVYHAAPSDLAVLFEATSLLFELAASIAPSSDLVARASLQHHSLSSAFAALFAHFQLGDQHATGLTSALQRVHDLLEVGPSSPDCEDEYGSIARSVIGIQLELAARNKDWSELKRIVEVRRRRVELPLIESVRIGALKGLARAHAELDRPRP